MLAFRTSGAIAAALAVYALGSVPAAAAKKISYEDAWAKCRAEVKKANPGDEVTTSSARQTVAAGCMKCIS